MSKLNGEELIQDIMDSFNYSDPKYSYKSLESFYNSVIIGNSSLWGDLKFWAESSGFELIEQEGGGEGGAEECHSVFKWKDKYYRTEYSYYSYHGYENVSMDNIWEVTPKQKTITVYE